MRLRLLALALLAAHASAQNAQRRASSPVDVVESKVTAGYRWYDGRWRLPQEIRYLRRGRPAVVGERDGSSPIDSAWFCELSPRRALHARDRLLDIARRAGNEELELQVRRAWQRRARALTTTAPRSTFVRSTALLGLHVQQSELLGWDTVPVSFGTGQGRIMLPRTRSISIGTTVGVPVWR